MKLSPGKSRITGLRATEIAIDTTVSPTMKAVVMLLRDDGSAAGRAFKEGDWSEKTQKAVEAFVEAVEEEFVPDLFEQTEPTEEAAQPESDLGAAEPEQF